MKRFTSFFISIIFLTGCSLFLPSHQEISVKCSPDDSILMIDGERYKAPVQLEVRRDEVHLIEARKDGYTPYRHTIDSHYNTLGILDGIGTVTLLLPVIGFLSPGARSLDETDITIQLYEQEWNRSSIEQDSIDAIETTE